MWGNVNMTVHKNCRGISGACVCSHRNAKKNISACNSAAGVRSRRQHTQPLGPRAESQTTDDVDTVSLSSDSEYSHDEDDG